jgi:hypothetical protein
VKRVNESDINFDDLQMELSRVFGKGKTVVKKSLQTYITELNRQDILHIYDHVPSKLNFSATGCRCFVPVLRAGAGANAIAPRNYAEVERVIEKNTQLIDHPLDYFFSKTKKYLRDFEHPYYQVAA